MAEPAMVLRGFMDAQDDQRKRESDVIASRYEVELEKRSPSKTMSPDWIAAQPKSLKERLRVTPEEEEDILFHFASTSSLPKTASLAGVGVDKVRAVVYDPDNQTRLADTRNAMRLSVIRKIEETQTIILEALQNETKLDDASLSQLVDVFTKVSETQVNLLSASRTTDAFIREVDPSSVFSGDELEYMAFLRRRLSASPTRGGPPGLSADSADNFEAEGHELVDVPFDVDEGHEVDISSNDGVVESIKDALASPSGVDFAIVSPETVEEIGRLFSKSFDDLENKVKD